MLAGPLRYGCVDGPPGKLDVYASICNATVAGIIGLCVQDARAKSQTLVDEQNLRKMRPGGGPVMSGHLHRPS
jgi:hypothetical protein